MTTNSYTLFYQQGEPQLHKTGCSHTGRNTYRHLTNATEVFEADGSDAALRLAGIDFAEALDYFDGEYEWNSEDGIQNGMDHIEVAPCAKGQKPQTIEEAPSSFGSWLLEG